MSGVDACYMIKEHLVPYADENTGKNIECWLTYMKDSPKHGQIIKDLVDNRIQTESKVRIYANWESKQVYDVPKIWGPLSEGAQSS